MKKWQIFSSQKIRNIMKRFLERFNSEKDFLSSLSLNALLAEEIDENKEVSVMKVEYRSLSCSYYNNKDHVSFSYFKDIIIPDID